MVEMHCAGIVQKEGNRPSRIHRGHVHLAFSPFAICDSALEEPYHITALLYHRFIPSYLL